MGICLQQIQTGNSSLGEDQSYVGLNLHRNSIDSKQVKLQYYYKQDKNAFQ